MTFGCTSHYAGWYSGVLDEAAFYTNALTAAQVLAHYEAGTNAAPAAPYLQVVLQDSPVGYWRMDEPVAPPQPASPAPLLRPAAAPVKGNARPKQQRPFPWEKAEDLLKSTEQLLPDPSHF